MRTAIHKKRTGYIPLRRRRRNSLILSPFSNKTRTLHGIANTDWNLIASRTEKIMSKLNTSGTSNADVGPVDTGNLKIERPKSGGIRVKAAHDSAPNNNSHTEKVKKNQRTKSGCIKSASHDSTHAAFPNKNSQITLKPNVRRGRRTSLTGGTPRKKQVEKILSTSETSNAGVGPVDTGNLKVKRPKSGGIRVKAAHDSAPNNDSHTEKVIKNQRTKSDSAHAAFPNKNSQITLKPTVRRGRRTSLTGGTQRKKQVDRILSTSGTSKADVGPVDTGNLKVKRPKSGGIRVKATGKTLRKKKKKAQFPVLGHKTIKKGVSKASAANAEKSDCETSNSRTSRKKICKIHGHRHESAIRSPRPTGQGHAPKYNYSLYWKKNVHTVNYARMQRAHSGRKRKEKKDAQHRTRMRDPKSISIVSLTEDAHWCPSTSLMQKAWVPTRDYAKARVLTCFICGKPGHISTVCPENPETSV